MLYTRYAVKLTVKSTGENELGFIYEKLEDAKHKAEVWNDYQTEIGGDCIAEVKKIIVEEVDMKDHTGMIKSYDGDYRWL